MICPCPQITFFAMDLFEIGNLVLFAKENYEQFKHLPDDIVSNYFLIYQDNIIVDSQEGVIRGFAIYQEWPEFYNFIIICHVKHKTYNWLSDIVRNKLTGKTIAWFDEKSMKPRFIQCRQSQQQ